MLLHVTLAAVPGAEKNLRADRCISREIVIEVTDGLGGSAVAAVLVKRYGPGTFRIAGVLLQDLVPGRSPFANGAVITWSPPLPSGAVSPGDVHPPQVMDAPLLLVVCSGPDSGSVTALHRGSYEVGRRSRSGTGTAVNTAPRIAIADPALSRKHALLIVGTDSVEVRDQGSANGTWVDGRPVHAAVVDTGSALRFGYSSCRLAVPSAVPDPESARTDPFEPQTVHLSEQGQKGGLLLVGALLPLILGVVLALATGMWMFLAFSGLSAVTALLGAAGARRRRREQTRAIDEAAGEDARGRRLAAPDPGTAALAAVLGTVKGSFGRPSAPVTPAAPLGLPLHQADDAGPCYPVRIGTAPQPANLVPVPRSSRFAAPLIPDAPVILRLGRDRDICLQGPDAGALCRTILLQAASAEASGSTLHIVCAGSSADLEPAARFLPGVTFAALPEASAARAASAGARIAALHEDAGFGAGTVLALCLPGGWSQHAGDLLAALPDTLREHTSVVRLGGGPAAVTVSMSSLRGIFADGTNTLEFIPDLVRYETFERLSRALAASRADGCGAGPAPSAAVARVPGLAAFGMHHPSEPDDILRSWKLGTAGSAAVVGMAADGPVTLDLQKDGPHFLVAGTTGSGKSEFLRSFIAALAAGHPPDAVTFLLIDFKGGSGLEPLGGLPHAVGLLTDLSAGDVARALMSLRAEVRRREALFAGAGADSMAAYNLRPGTAGPLPRLLVVVDEFRMLADEVPAALPELMRIAAIGRSLGLHLLLATQRPQGALTSDIRANIATTIALRVSSAAESRDILGSDCAAAIPAALPGRAFVAKGGGQPLAFQSLSTAQRPGTGSVAVTDLAAYLLAQQEGAREQAAPSPNALRRYCAAVCQAAERGAYPSPFRPVLQPLPRALTRERLNAHTAAASAAAGSVGIGAAEPAVPGNYPAGTVLLGLLDDPENQNQRELSWHPGTDSHLAVLGSPRAGTSDCLQLVTSGLVAAQPGRHLYILDADGSLAWLAGAGQTGAYVGPQDTKRAARVLAFLAGEAVARMASAGGATAGGSHTSRAAEITLVVSGWARWCTAFRSGRGLAGEDDLADLVRDGERAGICVVIAGERELLNSRFFPLIPNRLFFPADASAETLLLWPRLPAMDRITGRALVQGRIGTAEGLAAQLLGPEPHSGLPGLPDGVPPPHRIEPLPAIVAPDRLTAEPGTDSVAVGLCGDELGTAAAQVPRGSVFLVAGPPGSGRTSFLRQMQRAAHPSLDVFSGNSAEDFQENLDAFLAAPGTGLVHRLLLLVDDADLLPAPVHRRLAELQSQGARVVLAAASGPQLTARVPLALQVRSAPRGALLCPASPVDGDIFGIRIDTALRRPPGRCFLVEGTRSVEAQTAYRDE